MNNIHPNDSEKWFQFALENKKTGNMVGDVALGPWQGDTQQATFGVTIAPEHQKKGYASDSVKALLDYVFNTLSMSKCRSEIN
jgi:RimJ/RimL family protein N-acetyltransferase